MDAPAPRVVDADVHLAETKDDLTDYCDLPWRRVLGEPGGTPPWTTGGGLFPYRGQLPRGDAPASTPAELLARLDQRGVDAALLLPGPMLKLGVLPTADYCVALARAYNRWLTERWLGASERIVGAVLAAPHRPEEAARDVEHFGQHDRARAVVVPIEGVEQLLGDRRYDPLYAAAEAADLPVVLHGGGDVMLPSSPYVPSQFQNGFERLAVSHPLVASAHLVHLVGTGVLARFPGLKVVFLGAGVSWLAHLLLRMDKEYNENRRDVPFYTDRVSGYLRRQVWVGTGPLEVARGPEGLGTLIRASVGVGRVLYGSDWPNAAADGVAAVADAFPDPAERARVLGGNAAELFRIGAAASAAV